MTATQREIFDRIAEMKNQVGDLQGHLTLLNETCAQLKQERDAAIRRAERTEAIIEAVRFACNDLRIERSALIELLAKAARESGKEKETNHA